MFYKEPVKINGHPLTAKGLLAILRTVDPEQHQQAIYDGLFWCKESEEDDDEEAVLQYLYMLNMYEIELIMDFVKKTQLNGGE